MIKNKDDKTIVTSLSSYNQEVKDMADKTRQNFMCSILLSINTVLMISTLYLLYQNRLAEDMIRELNRDYEELVKEKNGKER